MSGEVCCDLEKIKAKVKDICSTCGGPIGDIDGEDAVKRYLEHGNICHTCRRLCDRVANGTTSKDFADYNISISRLVHSDNLVLLNK